MTNQRSCNSCGMPLRTRDDCGGGLEENQYCKNCCDASGTLKSYDEVLQGMKGFVAKNMGMSETEALQVAKENLAKMPAWK